MPRPVLEWERRLGRRLTLRDLHILKTVAQSGSMAKAARSLGMSQPSVSEAVAKLEAALRVRLLDRGPRGIEPTIYTDALLRREQVISDELQQGIRDIEFLANPAAGEVRIGCPENLACGFVPTVIDRMSRCYPKVAFHVTPVEPAAMGFRELRERSVDLMIGRILTPPLDDDLEAQTLFEDRLLVVAGASSPWARRRKITMDELLDQPWVHIPQNNPVNTYYARRSKGARVDPAHAGRKHLFDACAQPSSRHRAIPCRTLGMDASFQYQRTIAESLAGRSRNSLTAGCDCEAQEPDSEPGRRTLHRTSAGTREIDVDALSHSGQGAIKQRLNVRVGSVSDEPLDVADVWNRAGSRHGGARLYGF